MTKTLPPFDKILENRHDYFVEWDEPIEGISVDGNALTENLINRVTVHAAINIRRQERTMKICEKQTEIGLLMEFCFINNARIVNK